MPTIDITLKKGCSDAALEKSMKEITASAEKILENTFMRMIRISVFETVGEMIFEGGEIRQGINPTVIFTIGPGRSMEAKQKFASKITDILSENLNCPKEEIKIYIMSSEGNHFAIGGKPKVFSKLKETK